MTYPSLTLPTLVSLVPKDISAEIDVCDEISYKVDYNNKKYDIIVISFDTSSSKQAYIHSKEFKKRGAYIVMGGYHTSAVPKEAAEHCDTVIIGAGEISLPEFFHDYLKGEPKKIYNNQNIDVRKIKMVPRNVIKSKRYMKVSPVIADRGCDNKCSFCAISEMWKSNPRPVEDVIEEIKSLKSDKIIFFDPNFFYPKEYSLKLMKEMEKLKIKWAGNGTADAPFDDELMEAAKRSGCSGILIGFESLREETLKGVNKKFSNVERYKECIDRAHRYNIAINGCFVLGMDGDTEEDLLALPEKIKYLGLDLARFSILTPLPNSDLYRKMDKEGRIIIKDWSKYTQNNTVFQPENMSMERLDEIYRKVWRKTYTFKNIWFRIKNSSNKTLTEKFILLGANIGFKYLGIQGD